VAFERGRLLPPTAGFQYVHAAIAVDIADAKTMREPLPVAFRGNGMEFPRLGGIAPIRGGVAEIAAGVANDVGLAVAVDVGEGGRFVVHHVKNLVPLPMAVAAFWIFVPGGVL